MVMILKYGQNIFIEIYSLSEIKKKTTTTKTTSILCAAVYHATPQV